MFNYSVSESEKEAVASAIKDFYFGSKPISKETTNELVQVSSIFITFFCTKITNN